MRNSQLSDTRFPTVTTSPVNTYLCRYNGEGAYVTADTPYRAQQQAAGIFGVKGYEVAVVISERNAAVQS